MKMKFPYFVCWVCCSLLLMTHLVSAQTYRCDIKNINYNIAPNIIEFDIWLQNTGSNVYKMMGFQAGIDFDYVGLANGGTITASFVSGSNSLPAPQNNLSSNVSLNAVSKQIRITAALVPSQTIAASITSVPLKFGTFRLTNTVPFTPSYPPFFCGHL